MALSVRARKALKQGLGDNALGDEIADVIDNDTGSLGIRHKTALRTAITNETLADVIYDAIDSGTGGEIGGDARRDLAFALGDRTAADEIAEAILANA